jgi:exopolysaccharide biosynthesis polyprenyl glycosylphosphotransferase
MSKRLSIDFAVYQFLGDSALTVLALFLAGRACLFFPAALPLPSETVFLDPHEYAFVTVLWLVHFALFSVYDSKSVLRWTDEFRRVAVALTVATLNLAGLLYLISRPVPQIFFSWFYLINVFLLLGHRAATRIYFRLRPTSPTRFLIVGANRLGQEAAAKVESYRSLGCEVVGFLDDGTVEPGRTLGKEPILGPFEKAGEIVQEHRIDEVLIALPLHAHNCIGKLVGELHKLPIRIKIVPDYISFAHIKPRVEDMGGLTLIGLREPAIDGLQRFFKRLFDLAFTSSFLIIGWPIYFIIGAVIRLDSPGPAIFKQLRVGENGRLFWMYKFRSMVVDAEKRNHEVVQETQDGKIIHKFKNDPRITRVGAFLRRTTLDELPNAFNVFKGDMSLVGPRPELPWLVERYEPWQRQRFSVPQGMASWWLINGRSDRPMHLHTEDDLYYIYNYSFLLDLKIIWKAIGVILMGRGAF